MPTLCFTDEDVDLLISSLNESADCRDGDAKDAATDREAESATTPEQMMNANAHARNEAEAAFHFALQAVGLTVL